MNQTERLKEIVLNYYQLVDAQKLDELFSLFSDNVVYERSGNQPITGIDEFKRFYRDSRMIRQGEHRIIETTVSGDEVIVRGRFSGVLKDGRKVEFGFSDFFFFSDTKIFKRCTYTDIGKV
jgi:ketosteroid isomerase-like protein